MRSARTFSSDPLSTKLAKKTGTLATGGSTGKPKLIEYQSPAVGGPDLILFQERRPLHDRFGHSMIQLVCGPSYHSGPAAVRLCGFVEGVTTVQMERFEATRALDLIEQYRPNFILLVPLMMQRMLQVPDIAERDLSSIAMLLHNSAPCPAWVKEGWIDLIGGDHIIETYAGSENIGGTTITGNEWLEHPGSVGKPVDSDLKILDDDGVELPAGDIGLIYLRPIQERRGLSKYIGVPQLQTTDDGFMTLGDLGWLDEDGYLYIADRRVDMIVTGGANVYPAEVEAVLSGAPGVGDVVVIGVADKEWGRRVHAIIQPLDPTNPPSELELDTRCREHLASYKVPKTYEYLPELPRNAAGKIRRSALASERSDHL